MRINNTRPINNLQTQKNNDCSGILEQKQINTNKSEFKLSSYKNNPCFMTGISFKMIFPEKASHVTRVGRIIELKDNLAKASKYKDAPYTFINETLLKKGHFTPDTLKEDLKNSINGYDIKNKIFSIKFISENFPEDDVQELLCKSTLDGNEDVKCTAINSLGENFKTNKAATAILNVIKYDKNKNAVCTAVKILGMNFKIINKNGKDIPVEEEILNVIKKSKSGLVKTTAIEILGKNFKTERVRNALFHIALHDKLASVRKQAINTLSANFTSINDRLGIEEVLLKILKKKKDSYEFADFTPFKRVVIETLEENTRYLEKYLTGKDKNDKIENYINRFEKGIVKSIKDIKPNAKTKGKKSNTSKELYDKDLSAYLDNAKLYFIEVYARIFMNTDRENVEKLIRSEMKNVKKYDLVDELTKKVIEHHQNRREHDPSNPVYKIAVGYTKNPENFI